ncbi:S9 family peptidase [Naumannella sp. ID2617S]|nr:S9 family peptidase [Naumannella sp. ID2617S]
MDELGRPSYGASVSPDGRAFAHLVEVDGYPRAVQRWLDGMQVSTSRFVRLPVDGPVTAMRHSPDGAWLALEIEPDGSNRHQVWLVTTDPRDPRAWRVDDGANDGRADSLLIGWDGVRIAISVQGDDQIGEARLIDPTTRAAEVVDRRHGARLYDSWAGSQVIRTGPRSHRGVVLRHRGQEHVLLGGDPGSSAEDAIIVADRRPRHLRRPKPRRFGPTDHSIGDLDDLGGRLSVLVQTDHGGDRSRLVLATLTPDGVTDQVLAERPDADLDQFEISADGTVVALLWNVAGGHSKLQMLHLDDRTLTPPLDLGGQVASEASLSADGQLLAVTLQGPGQRRTVELVDPSTGEWVQIERPPRPGGVFVQPEFRTFCASDGLELNGWWYAPPGWTEPGPVVVWFHGGPEGQSRPDYSYVFPTLLEAGLAVFAPNVRGSGGFGRAFVHADEGPLRPRGISDVVDVVAHLVDSGLADPDSLAITGRSYGGYLTNATLAFHPGLFRAGVAICGMSDLHTFYRDTEPWIALAAYSKYGHPVDDADLLTELSPMRRVEAIDVPLLTIHGGSDTNVPVNESIQLTEALQRLGRRAECVVMPGEGHEFTKPENQQRLAELVRDWVLPALGGERTLNEWNATKAS